MKTKIPWWMKTHWRMKWWMALRTASLPEERWSKTVKEWNPGLDNSIKKNRPVSRRWHRWEDAINEFLKPEESEESRGTDLKNNDTWIRPATKSKKTQYKERSWQNAEATESVGHDELIPNQIGALCFNFSPVFSNQCMPLISFTAAIRRPASTIWTPRKPLRWTTQIERNGVDRICAIAHGGGGVEGATPPKVVDWTLTERFSSRYLRSRSRSCYNWLWEPTRRGVDNGDQGASRVLVYSYQVESWLRLASNTQWEIVADMRGEIAQERGESDRRDFVEVAWGDTQRVQCCISDHETGGWQKWGFQGAPRWD